jgi:hypothetical protein
MIVSGLGREVANQFTLESALTKDKRSSIAQWCWHVADGYEDPASKARIGDQSDQSRSWLQQRVHQSSYQAVLS